MKEYKIERMGLTCTEAIATWVKFRPQIIEMSKVEVGLMLDRLNNFKKNRINLNCE